MPKENAFATMGEMTGMQIEAALDAGIPRSPVLVEAGYGGEAALRNWPNARKLVYGAGIRPATVV